MRTWIHALIGLVVLTGGTLAYADTYLMLTRDLSHGSRGQQGIELACEPDTPKITDCEVARTRDNRTEESKKISAEDAEKISPISRRK